MKYTVIWKRDAEVELAKIWTDAADRSAVRQAAGQFDNQLAATPGDVGESRLTEYRIAFFAPLGFEFRVSEEDCRATVVRVWRIS